jgi:hypothetical protein
MRKQDVVFLKDGHANINKDKIKPINRLLSHHKKGVKLQ